MTTRKHIRLDSVHTTLIFNFANEMPELFYMGSALPLDINIDNFIGVYDNYITKKECDKVIKLYENQNKFKNTLDRISFENVSILKKQDQQFFAKQDNLNLWWTELEPMILNFDMAFKHYTQNTGANEAYGVPFHFTSLSY